MATFNMIIERDEDNMLVSEVVELPGCHTQARTFDELMKRTREAVSLYLKCKGTGTSKEKFLGLQQIEV